MNSTLERAHRLISEEPSLSGSRIVEVIGIMASGKFVNRSAAINHSNEKHVGEMTTYEKALVTLIYNYADTEQECLESGCLETEKEENQMLLDLYNIRLRLEATQKDLLISISQRFVSPDDISEQGYSYRSKNEIVLVGNIQIQKVQTPPTFVIHKEPLYSM